ncbi:MAG: toll/interleukin-1 receptor domain-containing protein, partial [Nitrososphaera sp.]|nr:toll/interleukin-1 receptor domain-containing protein [Nitrososphaera sp.]
GSDWKGVIDRQLQDADVFLLLVSSDFIASDYCFDIEMETALKRRREGKALVIPIILRSCRWLNVEQLADLQALPLYGKPIQGGEDKDEAFTQVVEEIEKAIEKHLSDNSPELDDNTPPVSVNSLSPNSTQTGCPRSSREKDLAGSPRKPTKSSGQNNLSEKQRIKQTEVDQDRSIREHLPHPIQSVAPPPLSKPGYGEMSYGDTQRAAEDTDKPPEQDSYELVPLDSEPGEFGKKEIIGAGIFGLAIAGINIGQRLWLSRGEEFIPWDMLLVNASMGISVFFLTASVLLFLSYESAKVALFISGVTRKIAYWYLSSICLVIVASHIDSFVPIPSLIAVTSHGMLFVVCVVETVIDLKLAACFDKISDHFYEYAEAFREAARRAIAIFIANLVWTGLVTLDLLALSGKYLSRTDDFVVGLLFLWNLFALIKTRYRIMSISSNEGDDKVEG